MGRQRRSFNIGFKQQVAHDIESGALSLSKAASKYGIAIPVIEHWRHKIREGTLIEGPSARERALERENRELKEKLGELYMQVELLKKMQEEARLKRIANTSIITSRNLDQFQKDVK